ncbi:MAG TPA: rod shape-determining protein [Bacillota bacterium]
MLATRDIGVDLGTVNTLVYVDGRGIVLREPTVVALDAETQQVVAIGERAHHVLKRAPARVVAVRPLRHGVIADYRVTEVLLRDLIRRAGARRGMFRPRVVVCVPSCVTTVERRAVIDAVIQAGARRAYVIEEPVAAALGAGLNIYEPVGHMVVDIGGGTTDIAVLSLGGVVVHDSLRIGGNAFDEAIVRYLRQEHNLLIGERAAEELKFSIGTAQPERRQAETEVRGRDLTSGLPRNVRMTAAEIYEAIRETLLEIVQAVCRVLERTPPELAGDIIDRGIVLTGGGALLDGIDALISQKTGVPTYTADDPLSCVALGTGLALRGLDRLALLTG